MASLMCKGLTQIARRTAIASCSRSSSGGVIDNFDQHKGKIGKCLYKELFRLYP